MSLTLKFVRAILIFLSLPGIAATLFAGSVATSLIYAEMYPDPNNIAHGMGMLALFPMIVWSLLALAYLIFLWLLWLIAKKISKSNLAISKKSNITFNQKINSINNN